MQAFVKLCENFLTWIFKRGMASPIPSRHQEKTSYLKISVIYFFSYLIKLNFEGFGWVLLKVSRIPTYLKFDLFDKLSLEIIYMVDTIKYQL